jgi:hypothetical protein
MEDTLKQGNPLQVKPLKPVYSDELKRQLGLFKATQLVHKVDGGETIMALSLTALYGDIGTAESALTLKLENMATLGQIRGTLCSMCQIELYKPTPDAPSHMAFVMVMVEPEVFASYAGPVSV